MYVHMHRRASNHILVLCMIHVPMTSCRPMRRSNATSWSLGLQSGRSIWKRTGTGQGLRISWCFSHRDLADLVGFHRGFTWIGDSPWDKMGISMGRIGRISSLHDFRMGQNQAPKRVDE